MSLAPKVEIKDGIMYQDGKPVKQSGEFYLVRKGTFEEITNRIRDRNTSPDERECEMSDEMEGALPQKITVDEFEYRLDQSLVVLRGKFLWIRYRTLEQELDELQGGQNE